MKDMCYVAYYFPGSLYDNEEQVEVDSWSFKKALENMPDYAHSFRFKTVREQTARNEDGTGIETRTKIAESALYYPGGKILMIEDVPDNDDNHILHANMKNNGWGAVIRTRRGGVQVYDLETTVVLPDLPWAPDKDYILKSLDVKGG